MTYGYDSQLINGKGTQSRFEDFADQLLVLLGQERNTTEERARPILFLCHSMGGLIARLAMVRYEKYRHLHPGVALGPRGLLLLSTPNAGSLVAQWSNLALELGSVLGLQSGLVKELRVLDPRYIDNVISYQSHKLTRCPDRHGGFCWFS
jgi:alpha-beta hydrolase superfamily lysophospholipase